MKKIPRPMAIQPTKAIVSKHGNQVTVTLPDGDQADTLAYWLDELFERLAASDERLQIDTQVTPASPTQKG